MKKYDLVVLGGGAAGFFCAINSAMLNPSLKIAIVEKNREVLQKVKVSGGGRCNVTNAITEPDVLIENYPRGHESLLNAFKTFGSAETFSWFKHQGVDLKIESDGRVFPVSNSSITIIDCFKYLLKKYNIDLFTSEKIINLVKIGNKFKLSADSSNVYTSDYLLISAGSDKHILKMVEQMGHLCLPQVPSLFTFNIPDADLHELSGVSFKNVTARIIHPSLAQEGPMIITHWGLSGPAILKLSAWAAIILEKLEYKFTLEINFMADLSFDDLVKLCKNEATNNPKKTVMANPIAGITQRFWKYICNKAQINEFQKWAETGKKQWNALNDSLLKAKYEVNGKSTFKEEFVTAGGVDLNEINLETFESKKVENLYFAGEILNIDAVTGGFNFQAAWTAAWIAANSINQKTN